MLFTKKIRFILAASLAFVSAFAFAEGHAPHWSYEGHTAPKHWADLEENFVGCKLGHEQSPIDISTKATVKADLAPIKPAFVASAAELVNNGHTIQINLADGGFAALPSGEYKLLQFHFHTPSEEKINGKNFPLVAHLVHKSAEGKLAVIAVLFKQGKENAALKDIFANLPSTEGKEALKTPFNVSSILPASLGFYAFKGSLTTPPCSEGVAWHVLKQPVEMSAEQIAAFKKIFKMNARPVQPLNGRKVQEAN